MRAIERGIRVREKSGRAAAAQQRLEVDTDGPVRHHEEREDGRRGDRGGRGLGAPRDRNRAGDHQREDRKRDAVVP